MRALLIAALLLPASALANAVTLDATTKSLELATTTTAATDYVVSYVDATATAFTPGTSQGATSSATTTTILAAPGSSTQRAVSMVAIRNRSTTASQVVTLKLDVSGTEYHLTPSITLAPGESLRLDNEGRAEVLTAGGMPRAQPVGGYTGTGTNYSILKVGSASEAAGVRYLAAKDSGLPGAWVPGTPGVGGATTTCSAAAGATVAGAPLIPDPTTGSLFLGYGSVSATVGHSVELYDVLWYNTGLAVTTTTAQALTSPTWPARDLYGSTNGDGLIAAIYVTTATTNASAVTNTTLAYKDESDNAGTATIASFPATAVAGTLVPFRLAAGDRGIRSIQSVTLGTSYGGGAISLVVLRPLWRAPVVLPNVGSPLMPEASPGVRLWNGTCLWTAYISSATTATTLAANLWVTER